MIELLHYIVSSIVTDKDSIKIDKVDEDGDVVLNLTVAEPDRPLIIGKGGMNIKAIRNLVSVIAKREGKKVYIRIID